MDFNQKLLILNKASMDIREALKSIVSVFKNESDLETLVWQVGKRVDKMQQWICKRLEKDIIQEEFDKITKDK